MVQLPLWAHSSTRTVRASCEIPLGEVIWFGGSSGSRVQISAQRQPTLTEDFRSWPWAADNVRRVLTLVTARRCKALSALLS